MKKNVTMKFPITSRYVGFGKGKRKLFSCYVGEYQIEASTVEDLERLASEFIERRSRQSPLGVAIGPDGSFTISRESLCGGSETYRPDDYSPGIQPLRCICFSGGDVRESAESYFDHMKQIGGFK